MKRMAAGRKIPERTGAEMVSAADSITGAVVTVSTLNPACAVRQMEQAWCDVVLEFSGWACNACTAPIAHTSAIESMQTTFVNRVRFAGIRVTSNL
jgi:hypothetical protein